ncbi:MAG: septum formation initiator family protein [Mucinivorans sp.]
MWNKIFTNRNIILFLSVLFVLWLLFFDRNNIVGLRQVDRQIEQLERERDFLRDQISADSLVIDGVKDSVFLETYARENFYKMRKDETMFIYR